ncbi:hypothetical protein Tco_0475457 [Tanacetum coccineum]
MDARTFQTLAAAKCDTTGLWNQTHWGDSMANNPMPAADVQLKVKRLTDADQSLKATSKIEKSNGYGSKLKQKLYLLLPRRVASVAVTPSAAWPNARALSFRCVYSVISRLACFYFFRRWLALRPATSVEGMKVVCQEFEAISTAEVPSASTEIPYSNAMEIDKSDLTFGIHPFYIEKSVSFGGSNLGVGKRTSLVP